MRLRTKLYIVGIIAAILGCILLLNSSGKEQDKAVNLLIIESSSSQGTSGNVEKDITLDIGGASLKAVLIPAGTFTMGGADEVVSVMQGIEIPQHKVTISQPFYMGCFEVTQEQFQQVMGFNPSEIKAPKNPVENVTWNEAVEFCHKVSERTGRTVTLPTGAQWEYACRAGTITPFNLGSRLSADDANCDNVGDPGLGVKLRHPAAWLWSKMHGAGRTKYDYGSKSGRGQPIAVGSFKPNAWGLYDMHGNVSEWCSDWYGTYNPGDQIDPQGPSEAEADSQKSKVLRGGSWYLGPDRARSASRSADDISRRSTHTGFRVVVEK